MRLFLVRHGITTYNISELYTGQTDAPLTELGVRQAEAAATYLATEKLDVIVSSDLQRARNTALTIVQSHNLPVLEDPELREIGMGAWEGFTPAQIQARNFAEWTHVRSDPITLAPPGGESFAQLSERSSRQLYCYLAPGVTNVCIGPHRKEEWVARKSKTLLAEDKRKEWF